MIHEIELQAAKGWQRQSQGVEERAWEGARPVVKSRCCTANDSCRQLLRVPDEHAALAGERERRQHRHFTGLRSLVYDQDIKAMAQVPHDPETWTHHGKPLLPQDYTSPGQKRNFHATPEARRHTPGQGTVSGKVRSSQEINAEPAPTAACCCEYDLGFIRKAGLKLGAHRCPVAPIPIGASPGPIAGPSRAALQAHGWQRANVRAQTAHQGHALRLHTCFVLLLHCSLHEPNRVQVHNIGRFDQPIDKISQKLS